MAHPAIPALIITFTSRATDSNPTEPTQHTPMPLKVHVERLSNGQGILMQNMDLQVEPGSIHTVMGASGSGKSSLLAAICGTLPEGLHFRGTVSLHGRRIDNQPTERRRVGILFQDDLLFAHMTVAENLLFAVPSGPAASRRNRVTAGLADLELSDFADADPATLSGGQRARVALMRALLAEPQALLLDEPFSRLDAELRARVRQFVFDLVRMRQIPALMVTHDEADIADAQQLTRLT